MAQWPTSIFELEVRMTVTVAQRKARTVARLNEAAKAAGQDLRSYALQNGGRFILSGSTATGNLKYDSDIDLIVDFAPPDDRPAYAEAERICIAHGLSPDVHYLAEVSDRLLARIKDERVVIG